MMRSLLVLLGSSAFIPALLMAQSAHEAVVDLPTGQRIFESQCAVCHGQGGTGGRGPALTRPRLTKTPNTEAIRKAIFEGLPPEMPGAWQLSVREVASVAGYVQALGQVPPESFPGDATRGAALFAGKGCSGCHVVAGKGTARGPELTSVGARRNSKHLRQSLVAPDADLPIGYLLVEAVTSGGAKVTGAKLAEDPFTIQIADAAGRWHSLRKADLKSLRRQEGKSGMPKYGKLPAAELDDLIAYLASLKGDAAQ